MKSISKYVGVFLVVSGIIIVLISKSTSAEIPLLVGLFTLFISKESVEDERSKAIRSSSALFALIFSYTLKLIISNLYQHQMITFDLDSINYFLIIVFATANLIRYARLYFSIV